MMHPGDMEATRLDGSDDASLGQDHDVLVGELRPAAAERMTVAGYPPPPRRQRHPNGNGPEPKPRAVR